MADLGQSDLYEILFFTGAVLTIMAAVRMRIRRAARYRELDVDEED